MDSILYITYDGLTDPLGQSQILPYLKGLSQKGYLITILSCEKKKNFHENENIIRKQIRENNLKWEYIFYLKNPPVLSTLWDLWRMKRKAFALHQNNNFSIIHCRSYIASLIGLNMKNQIGTKFIFDMRGFWVDERVEGGLWNLKNPLYKIIYNYFKKKEIEFLINADYTISLTEKAKQIIHSWKYIPNQPVSIEVIPCCVDIDRFARKKVDEKKLSVLRKTLNIMSDDFVLSYLGSIGTWYLMDEMLSFFSILLLVKPNARFLFLTSGSQQLICNAAEKINIPIDNLIIQKVPYALIPLYLSLSNVSIFFYNPGFSRSACSPVKQAELMSLGIPIICNAGVGDTDDVIRNNQCGIIIEKFIPKEYNNAIAKMDDCLKIPSENIRNIAIKHFSLDIGVERYDYVYRNLLANN